MTRRLLVSLIAPLMLFALSRAGTAAAPEAGGIFRRVSSAIESADRAQLGDLFPADRKIAVSLHQIADLEGFHQVLALPEYLRIMVFLPLFHVNAMLTSVSTMARGHAVVLRKKFSATEFWPAVESWTASKEVRT